MKRGFKLLTAGRPSPHGHVIYDTLLPKRNLFGRTWSSTRLSLKSLSSVEELGGEMVINVLLSSATQSYRLCF